MDKIPLHSMKCTYILVLEFGFEYPSRHCFAPMYNIMTLRSDNFHNDASYFVFVESQTDQIIRRRNDDPGSFLSPRLPAHGEGQSKAREDTPYTHG